MRRALPYLVLAAAVAGVLAGRGRQQVVLRRLDPGVAPPTVAPSPHAARPSRSREPERADAGTTDRGATRRSHLPPSLAGTAPDGQLAVDDSGRLVVTRETRRFFDYFLAAGAEDGAGRARARLVAEVRSRLPARAVPEAIDLLDRYLTYRRRARVAEHAPDAGARERDIETLRSERFTLEERLRVVALDRIRQAER